MTPLTHGYELSLQKSPVNLKHTGYLKGGGAGAGGAGEVCTRVGDYPECARSRLYLCGLGGGCAHVGVWGVHVYMYKSGFWGGVGVYARIGVGVGMCM